MKKGEQFMEYIKVLKNNPLFKEVNEDEILKMLSCLKTHEAKYHKHDTIIRAGSIISEFGILVEGEAHVIQDDYWGNRTIIHEIHIGELFGEAYACVPGEEMGVSLVANKNCSVLFFDIGHMLKLCSNSCPYHHKVIQNLLSICAMKNILLTKKISHITKRTTREKILSYLSAEVIKQGKHRITIHFNRQQLADYLSVDRSALSAELSRMQKEKLITYDKNTFHLIP